MVDCERDNFHSTRSVSFDRRVWSVQGQFSRFPNRTLVHFPLHTDGWLFKTEKYRKRCLQVPPPVDFLVFFFRVLCAARYSTEVNQNQPHPNTHMAVTNKSVQKPRTRTYIPFSYLWTVENQQKHPSAAVRGLPLRFSPATNTQQLLRQHYSFGFSPKCFFCRQP